MVDYQYTYLILSITFFLFWIILYYLRKDLRKEMLVISIIFAFAGPFAEIVYFKDWWEPFTLTNSLISIEPLIIGFAIGGIASVLAEEVFKLKHRKEKKKPFKKIKSENLNAFILLSLLAFIFFISFFILRLNSLATTILSFGVPAIIICLKRRDLFYNSILSGASLIIMAMIIYNIVELITPGWIEAFWQFNNTPKLVFLNMPLDDIIWYFLAGAFIGPLYEYWKEDRLVNKK